MIKSLKYSGEIMYLIFLKFVVHDIVGFAIVTKNIITRLK